MIPATSFKGKTVALFGLGGSGRATARALIEGGASVLAWDDNPDSVANAESDGVPVGDLRQADWHRFASFVLSPGVPLTHPKPHWSVELAHGAGVEIIGDVELFCRERRFFPGDVPFIAITGTNGKSTTTALAAHIIAASGRDAQMGGNIGRAVMTLDPVSAKRFYVVECSSYQIDLSPSLDPTAGILLNITPDHLDRYADFPAYAAAKARLFAMQRADQHAVFGVGDLETFSIAKREAARRAVDRIHRVTGEELIGLQPDWPSLQGPHNLQNAAAAIAVVEALGVTREQWRAAMPTFRGLPHRMERVAEVNGVLFINDSKATNPASAAPALAAFPPRTGASGPQKRIHWIVGGLPKGEDLDDCAPWFGNVAAAYTIGDAGPLFADLLAPHMPVRRSEMMCEAIREAIAAAQPGEIVMLSPACASFDQFRDYEARGDNFRQIVEALTNPDGEAPC